MSADAEARRRIAEDLDTSFFVEAAAGTGKTTALVGRIVALIRSGRARLRGIAAVTFTEKAAGEMKLRLRTEIERARAQAPPGGLEASRLEAALEELELTRIGTIHAFCGDLLHERPVEAGVDPRFEVASADEAVRLLSAAFDDWFQRTLDDPPEGVRRVLRRRPRGAFASGPREQLRGAVTNLVEHRDFPAPWRREPFDRDAGIDAVMTQLDAVAALSAEADDPDDWLAKSVANLARFAGELRLRENVRPRDHDGLEAQLRDLLRGRTGWHWRGRNKRDFGGGHARADVLALRDGVKTALAALFVETDADLAACLHGELQPVAAAYELAKQRAGVLDFVDLLVRARDLIVRDAAVRRELQERFTHFFVDEFQDTDPLQAEILLLLAADDPDETDWRRASPRPGKLFAVGDPKQSIYRFRRAEVAIYEQTKRRLAERGAESLTLSKSFRAPPSLQRFVNGAFAPVMQGAADGSQADYVPLAPARAENPEQPSVVVLPAPRPYGDFGTVVAWKTEESLADATGAFVYWLVSESGWTIAEREGAPPVPIQARHVCLIFRRFRSFREDVTRPYVRALEARRVPHVLVGGRSFHDREEVLAIRNALCAIEWPDDELRVYATLRGPLFALEDGALLACRHARGRLHPLRRVPRAGLPEGQVAVADALDVLRELHAGRNRRPIADTLSRLLAAVRAHAGIAIWPTGEQALANCLRSIDLARRFERRGAPSFRAFALHMESEALRGEAEDAPVVEEGTEGVRIMTAHRAKGLEFPVVVLCEPGCRATRDEPSRHVDPDAQLWAEPLCGCTPRELLDHRDEELARDSAEAVRVAYVAATRARDLLVVPGVADREPENGWLEVLNPAIYPAPGAHGEGAAAPGCPDFGRDAVAERPRNARRPERSPVVPGALRPRTGEPAVVWWDPNVLTLDVREDVGLRQQRILEADAGGVAEAGLLAHEAWQASRRSTLESGGRPSLVVAPVHALAEQAPSEPEAAPVPVETVPGSRADRPGGKGFGSLVHAVLAAVPLDAEPDVVGEVARQQGRLLGVPEAEVVAATDVALAALAHPVLRRAAAARAVRRETPVLLTRADGSLAEGVVDLAFRDDAAGRWTVVDFKTDRELGARRPAYEAQVRLYADAVAAATGEPAAPLLLVV